MAKQYFYGSSDFSNAQAEIKKINTKYKLPVYVLERVVKAQRNNIQPSGACLKVLDYMYSTLSDYGYTKEEFETYITKYPELLYANLPELQRRLIVSSYHNVIDGVLFTNPYVLVRNTTLNYQGIYASGRDLEKKGEKVTYENIFVRDYSPSEISALVKQYPMNTEVLELLSKLYTSKRKQKREELKVKLTLQQQPKTEE